MRTPRTRVRPYFFVSVIAITMAGLAAAAAVVPPPPAGLVTETGAATPHADGSATAQRFADPPESPGLEQAFTASGSAAAPLSSPEAGAVSNTVPPPAPTTSVAAAGAPPPPAAFAAPPSATSTTTTAPPAPPTTTTAPPAPPTTTTAPPAPPTATTVPPATSTTTAAPTTTSTTQAAGDFSRWVAGHESGDLSEWARVSISGDAEARVTEEVAHSGRFANALTIRNADGGSPSPGVRMAVEKVQPLPDSDPNNLPPEAFYSVYYYFPQAVDSTWWNVYQWKQAYVRSDGSQTRHPVYTVNVELRSDGAMYFKLRSKVGANGEYVQPGSTPASSSTAIPTGTWVHLECFYRWSQQPDGRISCWQDGELLWDVSGIITEFDLPYNTRKRQWTVNNYANDTTPETHTIFVDDAAVSSYRLGP